MRGEPGIGKSALLREASSLASGMCVLKATGVEAESGLAYAVLHQLLRPIQHYATELPAPQRDALRVALGLQAGAAADRFLLSLATLTLLSDAATRQPIVCVLDDANWADEPSLEVVRFVARRIETEPIAFVASVRSGAGRDLQAAGMDMLDLAGLKPEDAATLLDEAWRDQLAPAVREALLSAANGNPLALAELPRTLTDEQRAGRAHLPEPLPLGGQLEQVFSVNVLRLEPEARKVALVCAVAGRASILTIDRAAAILGVHTPVLELAGLEESFTDPESDR